MFVSFKGPEHHLLSSVPHGCAVSPQKTSAQVRPTSTSQPSSDQMHQILLNLQKMIICQPVNHTFFSLRTHIYITINNNFCLDKLLFCCLLIVSEVVVGLRDLKYDLNMCFISRNARIPRFPERGRYRYFYFWYLPNIGAE